MEKTLCGRYLVNVYSDGSIETSRLPIEDNKELEKYINVNDLSDSISQVLLTMKYYMLIYKEHIDEAEENGYDFDIDYDDMVRSSLKKIADLLEVNLMTVTSKVTKNLINENLETLTLPEFYKIANSFACAYYHDHSDLKKTEFYNCLMRSLPKRNQTNNIKAIELFTKNPTISFLLKNNKTF